MQYACWALQILFVDSKIVYALLCDLLCYKKPKDCAPDMIYYAC